MKIRKKDIQFFLVGCGLLFIPSLLRVGMRKQNGTDIDCNRVCTAVCQ